MSSRIGDSEAIPLPSFPTPPPLPKPSSCPLLASSTIRRPRSSSLQPIPHHMRRVRIFTPAAKRLESRSRRTSGSCRSSFGPAAASRSSSGSRSRSCPKSVLLPVTRRWGPRTSWRPWARRRQGAGPRLCLPSAMAHHRHPDGATDSAGTRTLRCPRHFRAQRGYSRSRATPAATRSSPWNPPDASSRAIGTFTAVKGWRVGRHSTHGRASFSAGADGGVNPTETSTWAVDTVDPFGDVGSRPKWGRLAFGSHSSACGSRVSSQEPTPRTWPLWRDSKAGLRVRGDSWSRACRLSFIGCASTLAVARRHRDPNQLTTTPRGARAAPHGRPSAREVLQAPAHLHGLLAGARASRQRTRLPIRPRTD